VSIPFHQHTLK